MWNSISESSQNFDLQKHSINKECTFERKCAWLIIVPGSCVKTNHPCLLLNLTQTSISGPVYCAPSNTSGAAYGGEPHLQQIFLIFTKYFCILLPGVQLRVGWPEVGEAKVGNLDIHGGVQKQVLRFQVSVDNASGKNGILLVFCACIFGAFLGHICFRVGNMETVGLGHVGPKYSKVYCSTEWRHQAQIILTHSRYSVSWLELQTNLREVITV